VDSSARVVSDARRRGAAPDLLLWPRLRSRGEERAMVRLTRN
jgi:hypothetical protein